MCILRVWELGSPRFLWTCHLHIIFLDCVCRAEPATVNGVDTESSGEHSKETVSMIWP